MAHLFYLAKLIFLLLLACFCFYFFGLPLFNKYFAKEVTVVESLEKRGFLKSPSITICPDVSWKNSSLSGIEPVGYCWSNAQGLKLLRNLRTVLKTELTT